MIRTLSAKAIDKVFRKTGVYSAIYRKYSNTNESHYEKQEIHKPSQRILLTQRFDNITVFGKQQPDEGLDHISNSTFPFWKMTGRVLKVHSN